MIYYRKTLFASGPKLTAVHFRNILEKSECEWKGQKFELLDKRIKSALDLVPKIIEAYDLAYEKFPEAYNLAGGSFGNIKGIKNKKGYSKYLGNEVDQIYADGFIIPIVVALRELIKVNKDGTLFWSEDPVAFIQKHINNILKTYYSIIKMASYNPQIIGKASGSYEMLASSVIMIQHMMK